MAWLGHCLWLDVICWKCHSLVARQKRSIFLQSLLRAPESPGMPPDWWGLLRTEFVGLRRQAAWMGLCSTGSAALRWRDRDKQTRPLGSPMYVHSVAEVRSRDSALSYTDAGHNHQERQTQLWEDLFLHPTEWWDNRMDKRGPRRPDFRHKKSGEGLWVCNRYTPQWVISRLASLDTGRDTCSSGCRGASDDVLQTLCQGGQLDRALDILMSMDGPGNVPSEKVYGILLKACTQRKSLARVRRVYQHLTKHDLETSMFVGEYVVSSFVKCGGLEDALQVFHRLPLRSVFSWTALMAGYTNSGQCPNALRLYDRMLEEGVRPNSYTFTILLNGCAETAGLEEGKRMHAEAVKYGCAADSFVASCLVDMYHRCGSTADAQSVLHGLSKCEVVPWNVMLSAYVEEGQPEKCLQLYDRLHREGVTPSQRTFVSALQACVMLADNVEARTVYGLSTKNQCLTLGREIHLQASSEGCIPDIFVGSTLITLYGKCGNVVEAQNVFDGLSRKDVISWNVIIGAYVEQGQAHKAICLYECMCKAGVSPNSRTFVGVLQAYIMLAEKDDHVLDGEFSRGKALEVGRALHAIAQGKGLDSDVFVISALIAMYGKCRSVVDAQNLFDASSRPDHVLWNALIAAYVDQGEATTALHLYEQHLEEGVSPSSWVFVSALQACGMLAEQEKLSIMDGGSNQLNFLQQGKAIHSFAQKKGCDLDVFVGSTLVSMYGKCGRIADAQLVFYGLGHRDVVLYNAMLAAYVEQGQAGTAFQLYQHMQEEGVSPNDRTFVSILQCCGISAAVQEDGIDPVHPIRVQSGETGKVIHAEVVRKRFGSHVFVNSSLLNMYGRCGRLEDALVVFSSLSYKNVVLWNTMLAACLENGDGEHALWLYQKLHEEGVSADSQTFVAALQACGILADEEDDSMIDEQFVKRESLVKVKALQANAWVKGYHSDVFVGSTMVAMYGRCGSILDAKVVFDALCVRDVVTWNAMLAAFVEQSLDDRALQLYRHMELEGVIADDITVVWILRACSNMGAWDTIWQIHQNLVAAGSSLRPFVASALISAYGRCSSMRDAQLVFDSLPQPNIVSWNALIASYARQGDFIACMQWYDKMRLAGVHPNEISFLSLLQACSHAGCLDKGVEYLESMSKEYGISPEMKHYVCIIDLFGRAGFFTGIEELLPMIPIQPGLTLWLCLLGACQKHGKVVLAEYAFNCAVRIQPKHPAAYVLMANIYSEAGLLDQASEVICMRERSASGKKPGQSWIEHDEKVYTFAVRDCKNLELKLLHDILGKVSQETKVTRCT